MCCTLGKVYKGKCCLFRAAMEIQGSGVKAMWIILANLHGSGALSSVQMCLAQKPFSP